jgi:4-amino-4-deoxy-L-arabinose transferase-like glycosyltransferase
MRRPRLVFICTALLVLALWLRLPRLDTFLTADEATWSAGAVQFLNALRSGDWAATNISGHPAVTTVWAGVIGLTGKWLFARPPGTAGLAEMLRGLVANPVRVDLLLWLRLPIVVTCALGILGIYLLARRSFGERVALFGAVLLSLDPFFLAHSRVLALDAFLATFITLAWLALIVGTRDGQRRYLVLSGLAIGLAILTKSPALVMGPLMLGWIVLARWRAVRRRPALGAPSTLLRAILLDLCSLGLPAALIIFLLWPALWVAPVSTLERVWALMTVYGQGGHELGNFWLGHEVAQPGPAFYPAVLLWRSTPVTLLGLLLAVVAAGLPTVRFATRRTRRLEVVSLPSPLPQVFRRQVPQPPMPAGFELQNVTALFVFVLWFGLILSTGDKKFDRYLLPVFPAVDLLAAWGLAAGAGWLAARFRNNGKGRWLDEATHIRGSVPAVAAALLTCLQATSVLAARPTYLTAYNPLAGGMRTARQVFIVGWGEGLAEAASYLNRQPGAESQHVASWYGLNVFGSFYSGQSYDLYYDLRSAADLYAHDVDYVVTYVNQDQRNLLDPSVRQQLAGPLFTSQSSGVTLASVFGWPKPFLHTTDRPLGPGLRLLGWDLGGYDARQGRLPVVAYWDLGELSGTPAGGSPIVSWLKDANGDVWAQAEATLDREKTRRVTAWLGRPAAALDMVLAAPPGLLPGTYQVEMAPFAGNSLALGSIPVAAVPAAQALDASGRLVLAGVTPLPNQVVFGNSLRLAGYALQRSGSALTLDLVWTTVLAPPEGCQFFVHLVDAQDQIVSQFDGPLGRLAGDVSAPDLKAGQLVRQRARLALPGGTQDGTYRLYVGAYRRSSGARLAVSDGAVPLNDGRYRILSLSGN